MKLYWLMIGFMSVSCVTLLLYLGWDFVPLSWKPSLGSEKSTPTESDSPKRIVCFGYVDAPNGIVPLRFDQPGRVTEVIVDENETVIEGQALLRLDDRQAVLHLDEAKQALHHSRLQLKQAEDAVEQHDLLVKQQQLAITAAQASLAGAQQLLRRQERLLKLGMGNEEEAEAQRQRIRQLEALHEVERTKAEQLKLQKPERKVLEAKLDLEVSKARYLLVAGHWSDCTLRAPCDGIILRKMVDVGEWVAPQGRALIQICPAGPRVVRAEIAQQYVKDAYVTQSATIRTERGERVIAKGTVSRLSPWITNKRILRLDPWDRTDVRTLECIVALPADTGDSLRLGERVQVVLEKNGYGH